VVILVGCSTDSQPAQNCEGSPVVVVLAYHKPFENLNRLAVDHNNQTTPSAYLGPRLRVPNLGYMYPRGYICLSEGVHLPIRRGTFKVSNRRQKYIPVLFIFKFLYISLNIVFEGHYYILLNISVKNHEKIFCHKEF